MMALFSRLTAIYPTSWRRSFKDKEDIETWSDVWMEAFQKNAISPEHIRDALSACQDKYKFPPSLPEFLSLCKYGGKSPEQLYNIAVLEMDKRRRFKEQNWPSKGIFWAASALGDDLMTVPYKQIEARWLNYLETFDKQPLKEIPEHKEDRALPYKPTDRESARKHIQRLKEKMTAW